MISYIISGENKEQREEEISKLLRKFDVGKFDQVVIETSDKSVSQAIGIEQIRMLKEKAYLKSFTGKTKAIVIKAEQGITIEAQNSLLKILEEPPPDTIIILLASTTNILLPTILSRCKVIKVGNKLEQSTEEHIELLKEFEVLCASGIGFRLKKAEQLAKNKEEALLWLKTMIAALRTKLLEGIVEEKVDDNQLVFRKSLSMFINSYTTIYNTNVNLRFCLENLFLQLPKT